MPDPPHGPPEITEAQQAATVIEGVGSPTPDNVSRAVQNYSPGAVAAAAASIGARSGGSQTLAEVLAEGADPDGNPITGPVEITLAESGTPLAIFAPGQAATLITGSGDSRLVWTAVDDGAAGNAIHLESVNAGEPDHILDVYLNGPNQIAVRYATDGASVVTSTAAQVLAAVNADGEVGPLVQVALAGGSNGSGLMVDEIHGFAGGVDGTDQDTFEPRLTTLPIADAAGVRIDTATWQDQIGDGNTMAVLVFPQDTTAFAIAIEGDEFPRYIFGADTENNGITMGDGSSDATGGPGFYYDNGDLALNNFAPNVSLADVLNAGNNAGANAIVNLLDPSGDQDAATKKYVDDFPVVLADGAVTTGKIADLNVTTGKLAATSVTTAKIAASAVTAVELADNAVTADKIFGGSVTSDKLADDAVTAGKIADDAVTTETIAAAAVTANEIATDAVTTAKIELSAVTTDKINAGAVTQAKIGNGAVTVGQLGDGAVTPAKTNLPTSNPGPGLVWNDDGAWKVGT